ncbi:MAG: hypothetical protein KatS3mg097_413 [Candidatus Parcubacteria bacterium]|nr:MAG: hypothetical protein KatS3mg097_413 [Candidatus Parcubacteria bacterium]
MNDQVIEIIFRFFLAAVIGALIGAERSLAHKQAGLRTFALVSLGAAIFSYLGVMLDPGAPSRVLANLVVGIGFIGAGIIFLHQEKIIGLTTAAALWVTTAVGALIGTGYYFLSFFTSLVVIVVLWALVYIEHFIRSKND